MPSPHLSSRLAVGAAALLLAVGVGRGAAATYGFPSHVRLRSWPAALLWRLRHDVGRRDRYAAAWAGLSVWSACVCALHFGGLRAGLYTSLAWWDVLTHATSGVGVAAALALTFRSTPGHAWVVPTTFAAGAGFEVYEFGFTTFWHAWTLELYAVDTAVDLAVNAAGALALVAALAWARPWVAPAASDGTSGGRPARPQRAPPGE
jgi:hypothetical protein